MVAEDTLIKRRFVRGLLDTASQIVDEEARRSLWLDRPTLGATPSELLSSVFDDWHLNEIIKEWASIVELSSRQEQSLIALRAELDLIPKSALEYPYDLRAWDASMAAARLVIDAFADWPYLADDYLDYIRGNG